MTDAAAPDASIIGLFILDVLGRPVERIPEGGRVEFIEEIRLTVAGTAGGTVVDAAKLGLRCLAVGAVGEDEKADFVLDRLERHGIDVSGMTRVPGVPTSATILNVRPNGERPALHVRGASDHFEVGPDLLERALAAPIVHLGGTGLLARLDGEPSRRLLEAAKARGRTTTFDLIAAHEGTLPLVEPLLPFIDYFMPSIEEAEVMSGRRGPEDCARFFLDRGAGCVVLTLGGEGAFYAHRDGTRLRVPAFRVDVVDTTGCGDAFDAGFIAALHHRMDPETTVRFAQAAAGLVATGLGSDAGIRSFEHTLDCMRRWPVAA
ncbi:carbohydrate kinase family protein [Rubellimicrobium sp. CFH 75288]|uniref:carbohydrate kinase family protein n=1 Tax=Rubellimicrobium sp. CFH 75288 TaxID=2697034 RepID=UPI0014130EF1|nr:sugar kinase [Rubellimicrobium sp. CFH 75288]NAZ37869.1 kinase [Rubellimicrobium sp. CFH 75288]